MICFSTLNFQLLVRVWSVYLFRIRFNTRLILLTLLATLSCSALGTASLNPTVLSLPSGPGSIEGLGESFTPQLNSGTGQYQVDLVVPPGRNGLAPKLSLSYNSGQGNGLVGVGVKLSIPYLQRQTDLGLPNYSEWPSGDKLDNNNNGQIDEFDEADQFIDDQGQELVLTKEGSFRAKVESDFIKYERLTQGWLLHYPNGDKLYLGTTDETKIVSDSRVFRWYPKKYIDIDGNYLDYHWEKLDQSVQPYLTNITYNHGVTDPVSVQFSYEQRPDILMDYRAGYEVKTQYRLTAVTTYAESKTVRQYKLDYYPNTELQLLSQLKNITEYGSDLTTHLPPLNFVWTQFDPTMVDKHIMPGIKAPLYSEATDFFDMDGDGLTDIINTGLRNHTFWLNQGPNEQGVVQWSTDQRMSRGTNLSFSNSNNLLADFDADGRTELLSYTTRDTYIFGINDTFEWEPRGSLQRAGLNLDSGNTRLIDINHDKRTDVLSVTKVGQSLYFRTLLNLPEGWSNAIDLPTHSDLVSVDFANAKTHLADMNGDRMPDIVLIAQVGNDLKIIYFPHRGLSGFGHRVSYDVVANVPLRPEKIRFADINGDGRADLINLNGPRAEIWLNKGTGLNDQALSHFGEKISITAPNQMTTVDAVRFIDINGNGSQDIIWYQRSSSPGGNYAVAELSPQEQPNQLKIIDNGLGKKTTLRYASLQHERLRDLAAGKPWTKKMPIGMQVIKSIEVEDSLTGVTQSKSFNYHNGWYNPLDKAFWGFSAVEGVEHGAQGIPSLYLDNQYHLGESTEALKGKIKAVSQKNHRGELFDRENYTWNSAEIVESIVEEAREVSQPQLIKIERSVVELNQGETVTLLSNLSYDSFGNTIRIEEFGRQDDNWTDERITHWRYSSESSDGQALWLLQRPIERKITDLNNKLVAKDQWFYDDEAFGGDNLGQFTRGNLTLHKSWYSPSSSNGFILAERYRYDDFGNRTDSFGPQWQQQPGHHVKISFDPRYHTFPVAEELDTGRGILKAAAEYDLGRGSMTQAIDFNGQTTDYHYDVLGRLRKIIKPGDTEQAATLTYDFGLAEPVAGGKVVNWIETRQREVTGGGTIDNRVYFDGLGRILMHRSEGEHSGEVIVSEQQTYNARGGVSKSYLPYVSQGLAYNPQDAGPHFTEIQYDALGRVVIEKQPSTEQDASAVFSRTTYEPLSQLIEDEEQTQGSSSHSGAAKRLIFDGLLDSKGQGRLRRVDEIVGVDDKGESAAITTWSTHYDYDVNGNFTQLRDAQGNVRTMMYDALGRNYFVNDANRGVYWQAFNDVGNLLATRDAKGQEHHYRYDGANRLTGDFVQVATSEPPKENTVWAPSITLDQSTPVVSYQYDTLENVNDQFLLGRLAKVVDQSGYTQFAYDQRGRVRQQQKTIQGDGISPQSYLQQMDYDSADRISRYQYSDGTHVNYHYNARGLLESIPNVVENLDYTAAGLLSQRQLANGVSTGWQYDQRQRVLQHISTRQRDNLTLQDLGYRFDAVSNLLEIDDERSPQTLLTLASELQLAATNAPQLAQDFNYAYDDFYRLTSAGEGLEQYLYRYDPTGNLLSKTDTHLFTEIQNTVFRYGGSAEGSNAGSWSRQGRGPTDVPGPHALTWANSVIGFDANGNRTNDTNQQYTWDHDNRLVSLGNADSTTQYGYDYQDKRRYKVTESSAGKRSDVIYVSDNSEVRDGQLVKYVTVGSQRIARSTQNSGEFTPSEYYLQQHLGSTALTLNAQGLVLNAFTYKPYGGVEKEFGPLGVTPYLFTGKERDAESGLGYFHHRYLNSDHGQFLSPDPVFALENRSIDPQQWSPYAYGRNNPIKYIDPNGEFVVLATLAVISAGVTAYDTYQTYQSEGAAAAAKTLAVDALISAAGLGAAGLGALKLGGKALTHGRRYATKSVTRFKHGDLFEHTINTKKGPVDFLAETVVKGDTLILKDVAVFGRKGNEALTGLQKDIFRGSAQLKDFARQQGFKRLEIQGTRVQTSSSARPGHDVNLGWDL